MDLEQRLFGRTLETPRLSRYELQTCIGKGGFGVVYRARDPELDRLVAIKVLGSGGRAQLGLEMMRQEARALARFSHPNVVSLYDVIDLQSTNSLLSSPVSDSGFGLSKACIVMEYVEGMTLQEWAQTKPPISRVMEVFAQAAQGLAAAHRAGIVHGDFKPHNVMLGRDGRVRILDFGLARVFGDSGVHESMRNAVIGTPAYMAPEQHRGDAVGVASDQYSFACTLFYVLFGQLPFEGDGADAIGRAKMRPRSVSEFRLPAKTPKSVREVLFRALAPDPAERFGDMDEIARVLVRRKRKGPPLWQAAILAGVVPLFFVARGASPANVVTCDELRESPPAVSFDDIGRRQQSSGGRVGAEAEAALEGVVGEYAARWNSALESVCDGRRNADRPLSSERVDPRLSCLERARQEVDGLVLLARESGLPAVGAVADAVRELPAPSACETSETGVAGPMERASVDRASRMDADLLRLRSLEMQGRSVEVLGWARDIAESARATGAVPREIAALIAAARSLRSLGEHQEAEATLRSALERAGSDEGSQLTLEALTEMIRVLTEQDRFEEARGVATAARAKSVQPGFTVTAVAELDFQVGVLRLEEGRPREAIGLFDRGLASLRESVGDDHARVAKFESSLGNAYSDLGDYDRARELYTSAFRRRWRNTGDRDRAVSVLRNNFGNLYLRMGLLDRAHESYLAALEAGRLAYDARHPMLALFHGNLANLEQRRGNADAVIEHCSRALAISAGAPETRERRTAALLDQRAHAYMQREQFDLALRDIEDALAVYRRHDTDERRRWRARDARAEILTGLGRLMESLVEHERVRNLRIERFGPDDLEVAISDLTLADTWEQLGELHEARELRLEALRIRTNCLGPGAPDTAWARVRLARSELALGRRRAAKWQAARALEDLVLASGQQHPSLIAPLRVLADVSAQEGAPKVSAEIERRLSMLASIR